MSSSSYSYPIRDLLTNSETSLGKLIVRAQAIQDLNQTFSKMLDPSLIPHCRVGTFENGVLTLFAENASYATRLRYHVPTILSTLRNFSQWSNLRSIQVKVQTHFSNLELTSTQPSQAPLPLSANSITNIKSLVKELSKKPGNEALISSLERLLALE